MGQGGDMNQALYAHMNNKRKMKKKKKEIRRMAVQSQPGQIVCKTLSKNPITKNWAGGVAQSKGPEFKSQYCKKEKLKKKFSKEPKRFGRAPREVLYL
jgi:hypothetical protein